LDTGTGLFLGVEAAAGGSRDKGGSILLNCWDDLQGQFGETGAVY
jgi:hypothetical protein